jgi:phospholipid/cholesterol/gamma-HCH transport system substrate-binding protein
METKARYVLIGLFTLGVILAAFGFVFWLHNTGGMGQRSPYRIEFDKTVSGLLVGSAVLFNGIKVGEVTALELNPQRPDVVTASVAIDPRTPVRADTAVGMDFQGLTGAPVSRGRAATHLRWQRCSSSQSGRRLHALSFSISARHTWKARQDPG